MIIENGVWVNPRLFDNIATAVSVYIERHPELNNSSLPRPWNGPYGSLDSNGMWHPCPEREAQSCCRSICPPRKLWNHCRTIVHIANLCSADPRLLRREVIEIGRRVRRQQAEAEREAREFFERQWAELQQEREWFERQWADVARVPEPERESFERGWFSRAKHVMDYLGVPYTDPYREADEKEWDQLLKERRRIRGCAETTERERLERQWFERAMPVMQNLGLPTESFRPSSLPARPPASRRSV